MGSAVFEAFATATQVGQRLDRLVEALMAAFAPLKMEFADDEHSRVEWVPQAYTAHLKLPSLNARRKEPAHLAVHFDLCREATADSDWPHARAALAVIAYAPVYDAGWQGDQLAVRADGRIAYEAQAALSRRAEGRLLAVGAPAAGGWVDAEWAFAVPFEALDDGEALKREIAGPVTALLLLGAEPEEALAATSAIGWAS